jgi:hypothetical protein
MNVQAILILVAGIVPGQNVPDGVQPKDWPYYAKVDLLGRLHSSRERWESMNIQIPTVPKSTRLYLDISQLKGWTDKELHQKADLKDVRVTGTLELKPVMVRPGVSEDHIVLVATTLEVVENAPPKPKKP